MDLHQAKGIKLRLLVSTYKVQYARLTFHQLAEIFVCLNHAVDKCLRSLRNKNRVLYIVKTEMTCRALDLLQLRVLDRRFTARSYQRACYK